MSEFPGASLLPAVGVESFILIVLPIRVQRIVRVEEEIAQAQGDAVAAKSPGAALGGGFNVEGIGAEALFDRFAPGGVLGQWVRLVLCEPLHRIAQEVDA